MSYQYPSSMSGLQAPPAGSSFPMPGLQSGPVDAAGYSIKPQNPMMGGYPGAPTGLAAGGAAYPPMLPGVGGPADPYGASAAGAYPPPPVGSNLPMGGASSAFGGNTNDLYAHAQQYGLSRGEVDAALQTYQEMSNMDRGMLASLGSGGTLQNLLRRIFGQSSTGTGAGAGGVVNDQLMGNLSRILANSLSTGRLPTIKEFLTLIGRNKMQYGAPGGMGAMGTGMGQQQYPPGGGMGMDQQQYPPGGMGMGMGQQQYPPGGMGMGGGMPPY
ncbi:uncharacterized protein ACA1_039470 [Acanthamoeba castellanii str. Neff]|uniref:Uncharacterized protein n=1 Tax=Acanthamoeba castellanii (strain ATCC 30010 / Neff) TaxID=1257118 RepID=L8HGY0_ACACF|nr:uncharacterized protein ACA1_039470 [Acanthamoeba castellanii str. Neff]ELR24425.1 hypothetical protein ACA1_039470 [Acanthamoeba castellanii str. Neff]